MVVCWEGGGNISSDCSARTCISRSHCLANRSSRINFLNSICLGEKDGDVAIDGDGDAEWEGDDDRMEDEGDKDDFTL